MKILGIGESVIDNAQMSNSILIETHVGGPSLIALILLSRLGIDCTLVTTLGQDEEAELITNTLQHESVKLVANHQEKTKVNKYVINSLDGSRKKIRGEVVHPDIQNIDEEFIRQFDLIIIDRHERSAFYEIIKKKNESAKIIIDPSTELSPFTQDMIKYADYPIIPIESLVKIGNGSNLSLCLKTLYQLTTKPVIITAGELGSILYDGKKLELIPSLQIKAVDVQGAGDIYRGAFAYGVIQGWDNKKSAIYANKVAALHCTKLGNAAAIPTKDELALLDTVANYNQQMTVPQLDEYFFGLEKTI